MLDSLDRILLQTIQEQHSQRATRDLTPKCRKLLTTFQEGVSAPIDLLYVLNGGKEVKELCIDGTLDAHNTMYFNPHISPLVYPASSLLRDRAPPLSTTANVCLIVDDCWERGTTIKKAVAYLEDNGYDRKNIFVFHFLGSGSMSGIESKKAGFVFENPVLLRAATMLDFFDNPQKYQ